MPKHLIQPRYVLHNGQMVWRVLVPKSLQRPDRPKRRHFGDDKKAADKFCSELEKERRGSSNRLATLPTDIQTAVAHALELLGDGRGREIVHAVELYLKHTGGETRTVKEAVEECIKAKEAANNRPRYVKSLRHSLNSFVEGREALSISEVSAGELERWINASWPVWRRNKEKAEWEVAEWRLPSSATKRGRQINLGTLFSFAFKRGWIKINPVAKLEKHGFDDKEPEVLTVEQCAAVLDAAKTMHAGNLLAIVALQLFGGIRPDESYRLTPEHIRGDVVAITGDIAKKRRKKDRRNVTINPTLKAWLDHAFANGAQLPAWDVQRRLSAVRKATVQPWPQDCLRHSFVSYHMEIHGWEKTVKEAGHSIATSFEHYRALVAESDAKRFWELRP